jgi:predicted O-methyltransferase YrrM
MGDLPPVDPGRVALFMFARDEEELVEENIRFHAEGGFDPIYVLNHGSVDRTGEILEGLAREGLVRLLRVEREYFSSVELLLQEVGVLARRESGAGWMAVVDADEFWVPRSGDVRDSLRGEGPGFLVERFEMMPPRSLEGATGAPFFEGADLRALQVPAPVELDFPGAVREHSTRDAARSWRRRHDIPAFPYLPRCTTKVLVRTAGLQEVGLGAHMARHEHGDLEALPAEELRIHHYAVRGMAQMRAKVAKHLQLLADRPDLPYYVNWHLRFLEHFFDEQELEEYLLRAFPDPDAACRLEAAGALVRDGSVGEILARARARREDVSTPPPVDLPPRFHQSPGWSPFAYEPTVALRRDDVTGGRLRAVCEHLELGRAYDERLPRAEAPDPQGWVSNQDLVHELIDELRPTRIIEVGSWKGASAIRTARRAMRHRSDVTLLAVDAWTGVTPTLYLYPDFQDFFRWTDGFPAAYWCFLDNVLHDELTDVIFPLPMLSLVAARLLGYLDVTADLVFLDGDRDEAGVRQDLIGYWPLVRPGGVLCGDDFSPAFPGVQLAVERFAEDRCLRVTQQEDKWWLRKPLREKLSSSSSECLLPCLADAQELVPGSHSVALVLAARLRHEGRFEEAASVARRALAYHPGSDLMKEELEETLGALALG